MRYIFSDKTGTLTENRMVFHTGDVGHPEHADIRGSGAEFRMARSEDALEQALRERGVSSPPVALDTGRSPLDTDNILWYLLNLSMCHELSILADDEHPSPKVMYQGASPDEVALARAAQSNGVEFVARTSSSITVSILGKKCVYRILDTLPFTSKRKLMSIILQGPCVNVDGELLNTNETSRFLLTKGADSAVMSLCAGATVMERNSSGREVRTTVPGLARDRWYSEAYYERLTSELTKLGGIGLRTLVLAYKPISDDLTYNDWHDDYMKAKKIVGTDQRDAAMEASWGAMERNFFVCGATAIEDKLQDQVPETIDHLIQAGIVVWMLTGDKQETAETIAGTARLVDKQTWQLCYVQAAVCAFAWVLFLVGLFCLCCLVDCDGTSCMRTLLSSLSCLLRTPRTLVSRRPCGRRGGPCARRGSVGCPMPQQRYADVLPRSRTFHGGHAHAPTHAQTPPYFIGDNEEVLEAFKAGRALAKVWPP